MNKKPHFKYPYQRVEQRYNQIDEKSLSERKSMEAQATKLSIGTLNFFSAPKPDTKISDFVVALNKKLPKSEFDLKLHQALGDAWIYKSSNSVKPIQGRWVHLPKPIPLQDLRRRLKESFADDLRQA